MTQQRCSCGRPVELQRAVDERPATWEHIHTVQVLVLQVVQDLQRRIVTHDQSKLRPPEREMFDEATSRLRGLTYGSEAYKAQLKAMGSALQHHYENNRHHPEHYDDGIEGMTLVDVMEMLLDWKAATMRHDDGDLSKSLEINKERFGISDQLLRILVNTAYRYDWIDKNPEIPTTQKES